MFPITPTSLDGMTIAADAVNVVAVAAAGHFALATAVLASVANWIVVMWCKEIEVDLALLAYPAEDPDQADEEAPCPA